MLLAAAVLGEHEGACVLHNACSLKETRAEPLAKCRRAAGLLPVYMCGARGECEPDALLDTLCLFLRRRGCFFFACSGWTGVVGDGLFGWRCVSESFVVRGLVLFVSPLDRIS